MAGADQELFLGGRGDRGAGKGQGQRQGQADQSFHEDSSIYPAVAGKRIINQILQ
jgi:hypothetical protein